MGDLDLDNECRLESKFEHEQLNLFHKQQKESKIKYCKEKLNRVCPTCEEGCDYKMDGILEGE